MSNDNRQEDDGWLRVIPSVITLGDVIEVKWGQYCDDIEYLLVVEVHDDGYFKTLSLSAIARGGTVAYGWKMMTELSYTRVRLQCNVGH